MGSLRSVIGHLRDLAVILALGTVYVVALSVGTIWKACVELVRWVWSVLSDPQYRANDEDGTLRTRHHDTAGETEK